MTENNNEELEGMFQFALGEGWADCENVWQTNYFSLGEYFPRVNDTSLGYRAYFTFTKNKIV